MLVVLLDNFDSFTYNIAHYLEGLDCEVNVIDHHAIISNDIKSCDALVISPGPGLPSESGKLMEMLALAVESGKPILGVCLGMQAIAEYFGGTLFNQQEVKHGKKEWIRHDGSSILFQGVPAGFHVGLYHSWAVSPELPGMLRATAFSQSGVMMALEHRSDRIFGVQFHPESIMSEHGKEIISNFLGMNAG